MPGEENSWERILTGGYPGEAEFTPQRNSAPSGPKEPASSSPTSPGIAARPPDGYGSNRTLRERAGSGIRPMLKGMHWFMEVMVDGLCSWVRRP